MKDVAIKVDKVSKMYKLYGRQLDRLKDSLGLTRKKCYQEYFALDQICFDVYRGEMLGIIGTNGSGKSTILKIITGVLTPTAGNVQVNGRIAALLELGAGFNMEYSGLENIYLNGMMIGFSREEIDAKLDDILEFADIGDYIHQPVKMYSSGMFIRLAFAVSINVDPEILIVDEALAVGDVFFQAKCYRKFEEFKEQGKTIVFVSHDLTSISKFCDRVVLLNKGHKQAEGTPKDVIDEYKKILVNQGDDPSEESAVSTNPEPLEYGNGMAEIYEFSITDENGVVGSTLSKGSEFTIHMKVRFKDEVREPIYAFSIKDLRGTEIAGTNTMFEKVYCEPHKAGEEQEISFRQKIDLQGGEYLLSLGCTGYVNGNFDVFHRLYDICNITVVSDKNSSGYYDMNSKIHLG